MPNAKAMAKADSVVTARMMSSRLVYNVALTFWRGHCSDMASSLYESTP